MIQVTGKAIIRRALMPGMYTRTRRDVRSVEIQITLEVSSVKQRNSNASLVISMDTSQASDIRRNKLHSSQRKPKALMFQVGAVYAYDKFICHHSEDCSSSNVSFCLQVKIQQSQAKSWKIPTPSHLITNLAYKLKPH